MTAWHSITIVQRPNRTIHIFDYVPCIAEPQRLAWHHRIVVGHGRHTTDWFKSAVEKIWRPAMTPEELHRAVMQQAPVRHPLMKAHNHQPLDRIEDRLPLDKELVVYGPVLSVVLDALRLDGRRRVDVVDLRLVADEFGPTIARLGKLPPDVRRRAEPALYTTIQARCTKL